ncbi:MAG: type II toxin-antitoxin system prevent-host-death family antitoxin [Thermoleophilia bacterium]|nr:type II toxin-antitoxin system prevent-host-death family antitoxin [Thermoleophilia bacterium]
MSAEAMGIRELRQNLSRTIRRVRAGETIEVTERGQPVALLTPIPRARAIDRLIAQGKATPAGGSLSEFLREHPPRPSTTGITASEALQHDRGD